ncbi:MAG: hypothetical protein AAF962_02275 [Actinomycetota bacterium]
MTASDSPRQPYATYGMELTATGALGELATEFVTGLERAGWSTQGAVVDDTSGVPVVFLDFVAPEGTLEMTFRSVEQYESPLIGFRWEQALSSEAAAASVTAVMGPTATAAMPSGWEKRAAWLRTQRGSELVVDTEFVYPEGRFGSAADAVEQAAAVSGGRLVDGIDGPEVELATTGLSGPTTVSGTGGTSAGKVLFVSGRYPLTGG